MNKEYLAYLLQLEETDLKNLVYSILNELNMNPVYGKSYVYSKGNIPIMLVAHMDTVFDQPPQTLYYDNNNDVIFSPNGGIGGDDRCGVYAILKILKETDFRPYILFTQGEEIGGIGAKAAVREIEKPDVKYILEFDRAGSNDCVFYECGNEEFIDYITSFKFEEKTGSFSDISILGTYWDIAAVNISSGYYKEHTVNEHIVYNELLNNINRVIDMIKVLDKCKYYDCKEITYDFPLYGSLKYNERVEKFIENMQKKYIKKKNDKDN